VAVKRHMALWWQDGAARGAVPRDERRRPLASQDALVA
jgi:hypothetical protein